MKKPTDSDGMLSIPQATEEGVLAALSQVVEEHPDGDEDQAAAQGGHQDVEPPKLLDQSIASYVDKSACCGGRVDASTVAHNSDDDGGDQRVGDPEGDEGSCELIRSEVVHDKGHHARDDV
eukprot:CAMPEP_0206267046 /NCGR_PEP_ID=MMETSP0047_2-20121206/30929_1 /ASSEMBLY_ACC=CAM_ASM_000192 /TAXON_ID=195065 /ORGANISM="Chroomonas mesostigmatica_cf, Strain CCMP1168" /LENGTH=120 /DNA_ID=CAMNT_0053695201 /DNA_START=27 /DNA_END=390 /DNA_ORIENTATION=+